MEERKVDLLFEPTGVVLIRTPLLPISRLQWLLSLPYEPQLTLCADTLPGPSAMRRCAECNVSFQQALHDIVADPIVQEAILAASPDLFHALPRWQRDPAGKKGRLVQTNLLSYVTRMASRPTPFGLFAGVSLGRIGQQMHVQVCPVQVRRKRARPDMQWLLALVGQLEQRPEVACSLRFSANPAAHIVGGRLYILNPDFHGQAHQEANISLRATGAVRRVLELARDGVTLGKLHQRLREENPEASVEQIQNLLNTLRENEVLLSELRPPLTGSEPLHYVRERIADLPGCRDVCDQLDSLCQLLAAYEVAPLGQGVPVLHALRDALKVADQPIHLPLEVDMATLLEADSVSETVANELANAAEALIRTSTVGPELPHLHQYRQEFLERYGEGREVPLLTLLDETLGLGPPATYHHPPRSTPVQAATPPRYPQRERVLLELAAAAIRNEQHEIVLNESLLQQLEVHPGWRELLPDSLELYATLAASSQEAINKGDYLAIIGPRIGTSPAGRSFARFCDILGPASSQHLVNLAREEESRGEGRIFAELVTLPRDGHAANVVIRPATRLFEIPVGATPSVTTDQTLPLADLLIGVHSNRFYVRSVSRGQEVVVCNTHLLNHIQAANICRFLAETSTEGFMSVGLFDWGCAEQLPFLPRVRVGRSVLRPAEWHLPLANAVDRYSDPAILRTNLETWCRRWRIPRYVYLAESDHRLLLDLQNQACWAKLADELRKRVTDPRPVILQEMLPGFEEAWARGPEGLYLQEFVVPFIRRVPIPIRESIPIRPPIMAATHTQHMPGSEWLYMKLYCGPTQHTDLLAGPIQELVEQVRERGWAESCFFIRYNDPDSHIRLRFRGTPAVLLTQVLPMVAQWSQRLVEAGHLRKLVIDSYDRELERYGGLDGMNLAEEIFAADSLIVMPILALQLSRTLALTPIDLALLSVDNLVHSLGLRWADRLLLYTEIQRRSAQFVAAQLPHLRHTFHTYRPTAQRLLGDRAWLRRQPAGLQLEECLQARELLMRPLGLRLQALQEQHRLTTTPERFLADCVHMHCNRLLGVDRALEGEVMYYLQRTLESLAQYMPAGIHL